jgi:hypothetical protein
MNESGDELPKFVISPRKCRLPDELLMVAMSQHFSSQSAYQCSPTRSTFLESSNSRCSPRERRMRAQPSAEQHSTEFPKEWGSPPSKLSPVTAQLPEGYGVGSVTMRSWILHRMHRAPIGAASASLCAASTAPDDSHATSQLDDAMLGGIDASTRRMLRHPDVPWAPDGSSWTSFKEKSERERENRRQEREAARSSAAQNQSFGPLVLPIIPPLLLEPFRQLQQQRHQDRPATPLSTRHLLHQLQQRRSGALGLFQQQQVDQPLHESEFPGTDSAGAAVSRSTNLSSAPSNGANGSQSLGAATSKQVEMLQHAEQLDPVSHEAALTQRLMRLSNLNKRFKEIRALSGDDKKEAAALFAQRANAVLELRRHKLHVPSGPRSHVQLSPKAQRPVHHDEATPKTGSQIAQSQHFKGHAPSPRDSAQTKRDTMVEAVTHEKGATSRHLRAFSERASRQRFWIATLVQVQLLLLFRCIIRSEQVRRADEQKRQVAVLAIQKVFRWKLIPYYVRQLVNAVKVLKPWMADALLRWRRRRLHRSADILRHVLLSCRNSNKIASCIRAFRQKVVRIQRNIRSFLLCTQARVIRLMKLLHVQVLCLEELCSQVC